MNAFPKERRERLRLLAHAQADALHAMRIPVDDLLDCIQQLDKSYEAYKRQHRFDKTLVTAVEKLTQAMNLFTIAVDKAAEVLGNPNKYEKHMETLATVIELESKRLEKATEQFTAQKQLPPNVQPVPPPAT